MFNFEQYGNSFLAMRLHKLRVLVTEQCDYLFEASGVTIPSHCVSVVLYLTQDRRLSIAKIASELGYSHQLISQRLDALEQLSCIKKVPDARDKRRWLVVLTAKGRKQARLIEDVLARSTLAFDNLFQEIEIDLDQKLQEAFVALEKEQLSERLKRISPTPSKKVSLEA